MCVSEYVSEAGRQAGKQATQTSKPITNQANGFEGPKEGSCHGHKVEGHRAVSVSMFVCVCGCLCVVCVHGWLGGWLVDARSGACLIPIS